MNLSLNIGCGKKRIADVNIDVLRTEAVDIVADARYLPFKAEIFKEVSMSHVIEHFSYKDAAIVLNNIMRILKINAHFKLLVPNVSSYKVFWALITNKIDYNHNFPIFLPRLTGNQDNKYDIHLSQWNVKLLKHYLVSKGFKIKKMKTRGGGSLISKPFVLLGYGNGIHVVAEKIEDKQVGL